MNPLSCTAEPPPALLRSGDALPRLAVWRVLCEDKVLSPRPHSVTERLFVRFVAQLDLPRSSHRVWVAFSCLAHRDTQAKGHLLVPALMEKRRLGLQTDPKLVSTLQNHLAVGAGRRRAGRMQTCIPLLS